MGNTLTDYRLSIGLFNNAKFVKTVCSLRCTTLPIFVLLILLITLLLLRSGTLELNPGPTNWKTIKNLKVCHLNIRGLNDSKLRALKTSLSNNFDIITISETFLGQTVPNSNLQLSGFHELIRRDRPTFGGGIAVYIRDNLAYKRMLDCESQHLEQIWIQLTTKEGKILICTVYRPPTFNDFWEQFDTNLDTVKASYSDIKYFLVLGDMNADFADVNGKRLKDLCYANNLQILINEPTRFTETKQSCLDQILTNMPNFVKSTSVIPPLSTNDHCTVSIELNFKLPKDKAYTRLVWKYHEGDCDGFKTALRNANWDECFIGDDANYSCDRWSEKLLNIARTFIPNKSILVRPNDSPWYSNNLRLLKRRVDRLYKNAKKRKTVLSWDRYKTLRNQYQSALDEAENNFKKSRAASLQDCKNTRQWWKTVKNMLGRGGQDSYPAMIDPDTDTHVCDNKQKADLFNKFFLSHSKIDTSNTDLPNNQQPVTPNTLNDIVATEQEVLDLINSLETNKSTGPDGISPQLLKIAGDAIVPSLTRLINLSLYTSTVPKSWKRANVTPVHKKGDKDHVNNYRPISLLPTVSKILEKIVFKHVYNHLLDNNILSEHQSGFRPGDSTVNQLAYMYHQFCDALDKKKDVKLIFCDVSKAFDQV